MYKKLFQDESLIWVIDNIYDSSVSIGICNSQVIDEECDY